MAMFRCFIIGVTLLPLLRAQTIFPNERIFRASCDDQFPNVESSITTNDIIHVCDPIQSIIERCQEIVQQPEPEISFPNTTPLRIVPSTGIAITPLVQDCFFKECSERLVKYFRISRRREILWPVLKQLAGLMEQVVSDKVYANCTARLSSEPSSPYRTADGRNNNLKNPSWGASRRCFNRLRCPDYNNEYELFKPRKYSKNGKTLPTSREVSVEVHRSSRDIEGPRASLMTMQWGQFLDHDLTLTPLTKAVNTFLQCCQERPHSDCFAIPIGDDDPFYSSFGVDCLNFVRAAPCHECGFRPREQTNFQTSYLDASMIYGASEEETATLRGPDGKLDSTLERGKPVLPKVKTEECVMNKPNYECFKAGDPRVNEQPGLLCMQTLWMRQHNHIAEELKRLNPNWNSDTIFQEARKIVGAQIQLITYRDWLPLILGKDYVNYYNLNVDNMTTFNYDPSINPTVLNEFSAAAFRFGHTLIHNRFPFNKCRDNSNTFELKNQFNNPRVIYEGNFDTLLRGLFSIRADKFDSIIIPDVIDHLVQTDTQNFGLDLAAFNIQRARDVGLNSYTHYLRFFFGVEIEEFSDLQRFMSRSAIKKLENVYDEVDDIDLFTGGVSENSLPDGVVGPTIGAIVGLQYHRVMFGDRYFFLNQGNPYSFTPQQLESIRKTTLGQVICYNSDKISFVTENVFISNRNQKKICCSKVPDIDLTPWATDSNFGNNRNFTNNVFSGQSCPCDL